MEAHVDTFNDLLAVATREFVTNVDEGYRYGQALFNVLLTHRPDLAEQVRGTDLDPFHEDTLALNSRTANFLAWVQERWHD